MDEIVRCKYCGKNEFWGSMMWLSGKNLCRRCYKIEYARENGKPYAWNDLDAPKPPQEDLIDG